MASSEYEEVFTDRHGRRIVIRWSEPDEVLAYHGKLKVGYLAFRPWGDEDHDDTVILSYATVLGDYQCAGIALQMMRVASRWGVPLIVPGLMWNERRDDQLHTTQDGRRFLSSCVRHGILRPQQYADYQEWADEASTE